MSYELHNTLHGLSRWLSSGGWIVLLVVALVVAMIAYAVRKSL